MIQNEHGIRFALDSGRVVKVDLFTIETKLKNVLADNNSVADLSLLAKRRWMDFEEHPWFDESEVHFAFPDDLTEISSNERSVLVSVVLWSDPISAGFDFSEMMVVFYVEYRREMSIEQMLREGLHDLAWDELAIDRHGAVVDPPELS